MQRRSGVVLTYHDIHKNPGTTRPITETTMEFEGVGEIIATRQLYYFDESNRKRIVSIFVGKPQPSSNTDDYQCLFQIIGLGDQNAQVGYGYDSIQALQSALILAVANLNYLSHELGREL